MVDSRSLCRCAAGLLLLGLQTPSLVTAQEVSVPAGLTVNGTITGTYDSRLVAGLSGIPVTTENLGGLYPAGGFGLSFRRTRPTRDWALQAQTNAQYVHQIEEPFVHSHRVNLSGLWRTSARTTVDASAISSFATFYNLSGLVDGFTALSVATPAVLAPVASPLVRVVAQNNWWQGGRVGVTRQLSPRMQLGGGLGVSASTFSVAATGVNVQRMTTVSPRAVLARQLTSRTTFQAQYTLDQNIIGSGRSSNHQAEGGFDYRGRALLVRALGGVTFTAFGSSSQRQGIGTLRVSRPIAQGWSGGVGYQRSVQFSTVFAQFLNSDNLDGALTRTFGRNVALALLGNYSRGVFVGFNALRINSRSLGGQVNWAMTRAVGVIANYNYFVYSLADSVALNSGLPPEATRNVVSVGLAWQMYGRP